MAERAPFASWAVLELMGHQQIAGFVSEEEIGGSKLLRVDVPELELGEITTRPAYTKYFGTGAVYALHPTTEALARQAAARLEGYRAALPVQVPDLSKASDLVDRAREASRYLAEHQGQLRARLTETAGKVVDELAPRGDRFEAGEAEWEEDDDA